MIIMTRKTKAIFTLKQKLEYEVAAVFRTICLKDIGLLIFYRPYVAQIRMSSLLIVNYFNIFKYAFLSS